MNTETILRLLQNSGFHILGTDGTFLYLEDPSCVLRSFETFIEYAWVVIVCITGVFLFGWAISLIRGVKGDYFNNLRNLIIIFGTLSAVIPIINLIYGDDLFAKGCRTIKVSMEEVNEILDARNLELSKYDEFKLYENIEIYDSGAPHTIPYYQAPLMAPDIPEELETVTVTPDTNTSIPTPQQPQSISTETNAQKSVTSRPISAKESSRDVIYSNSDGSKHRRTGGTRAWRNMNPGNIRYSDFARRAGAIGEAGGFAVFPDEETGMQAISQLLRSDSYNRLTVAGAISRYAPPIENDTSAYHRRLQDLTGLSINRQMSSLTNAELSRVANAIRQIEGWTPGRVVQN